MNRKNLYELIDDLAQAWANLAEVHERRRTGSFRKPWLMDKAEFEALGAFDEILSTFKFTLDRVLMLARSTATTRKEILGQRIP
jgi:hypothetical protein